MQKAQIIDSESLQFIDSFHTIATFYGLMVVLSIITIIGYLVVLDDINKKSYWLTEEYDRYMIKGMSVIVAFYIIISISYTRYEDPKVYSDIQTIQTLIKNESRICNDSDILLETIINKNDYISNWHFNLIMDSYKDCILEDITHKKAIRAKEKEDQEKAKEELFKTYKRG